MWDSINGITGKAQTELFLFLILGAILLIVILKPALAYLKNRKEQEMKREEKILNVISGNSSVMAELKTLLKESNDACHDCKAEQLQILHRVEEKHNNNTLVLNQMDRVVKEFFGGQT